ncbi:MAG: class I SAM-dependent DNA methyltransferase, partial [Brasilonema sp.]
HWVVLEIKTPGFFYSTQTFNTWVTYPKHNPRAYLCLSCSKNLSLRCRNKKNIMTSLTNRYSEYDGLASIYDKQGTDHHETVVAQLEKFVLQHLPKEAHIFDLCCGTGQVLQRLAKKGYQVTGLDGSEAMLQYARKNIPSAEFILDEARFFKLPPTFNAVISTDVALNHVMSLEELKSVFQNVYGALLENGLFVFDFLLEELYTLTKWTSTVFTGDNTVE